MKAISLYVIFCLIIFLSKEDVLVKLFHVLQSLQATHQYDTIITYQKGLRFSKQITFLTQMKKMVSIFN